jgi:Zn-dependent protease with chaperone function/Flp pilus assembly protein TadD
MGSLLRLLMGGCLAWACLVSASARSETPPLPAAPPAEESDGDGSHSLAPLNELPRAQVDSAAQMLVTEGDRLAGLRKYREAMHFYSSAMALAPRDPSVYIKRAEMYRQIGERALAEQDLRIAALVAAPQQYEPAEPLELFPFAFPFRWEFDASMSPIYAAIAWLALAVVYGVVGFRQSREEGGTILRLIGVAAGASLIALTPMFVWLAAYAMQNADRLELALAFPLMALSAFWMSLVLRPPHRPTRRRPPLPRVEDEALLARVARLAGAMGIVPPRLRLLRSVGGAQRVLAWAGGLPAPSVIVTDGLLTRLDDVERDAVIAHEIGHIANHSLWPLSSLFSVSCAVALLAALWHPIDVALAFSFAFFIGLRRIISRPIEADCDRRAARVIGYDATISALKKIHALHSIRNSGWMSLLAYAWATHPSPEMRLSLLARAARREDSSKPSRSPEPACNEELPKPTALDCTEGRFRLHRAVSWLGVALWVGALSVAWCIAPRADRFAFWLLMFVACTPIVLLSFARTAAAKRASGRQRVRPRWQRVAILLAIVLLIALPFVLPYGLRAGAFEYALFGPLVIAIVVLTLTLGSRRDPGLSRQINEALQEHRFGDLLAIARMNRKQVVKQPLVRYNVAFVEGIHGDRSLAIAELEEMCRKYRSFALPALTLCLLYFEQGDHERALDVARRARDRWPKDPLPSIDEARVLRQMGRLEEAQAAVDRALRIDPDAGGADALAAGISLDRGDRPAAEQLAERAGELEPGGLLVLVAKAEVALAAGDRELGRKAVERAVKTIKANPFAVCGVDLARLERQLAELDAETVPN